MYSGPMQNQQSILNSFLVIISLPFWEEISKPTTYSTFLPSISNTSPK